MPQPVRHRFGKRFLLLAALLGSRPAIAQQAASAQPPRSESLARRACGISASDGKLHAIGPRYLAELRADAIVYTPALGRQAPSTAPWSATPLSVGREQGAQLELGLATPLLDGGRAELTYAGGLRAIYEARPDGLEQSFAIDARPAGSGELVIRQRIESGWPLASIDAQAGIEWGSCATGGLRLGGVTAIDANGAKTAGSLALRDGLLEYRVPAAFVDAAAFPLLVDPLIGTLVHIGGDNGALEDIGPDAAFEPMTARYLVAWTRQLSSSSAMVVAQRTTSAGGLVGAPLLLSSLATVHTDAKVSVAVCPAADSFVVASEREFPVSGFGSVTGVELRAVSAITGAISPSYGIYGALASYQLPVLASQRSSSDNHVILLYAQSGLVAQSQIEARKITVSAGPALGFGNDVTVHIYDASQETLTGIAISRSGGTQDRYLFAFSLRSGTPADTDIRARVLDGDLAVQSGAQLIATSSTLDERHPTVDGDGTEWVVAWEQSTLGGTDSSIWARRFTYGSLGISIDAASPVSNLQFYAESEPAIAFTGETYLLAWEMPGLFSTDDVWVASLNRVTLDSCGAAMQITNTGLELRTPAIAPHYAAGLSSDQALVLCDGYSSATGGADIYGQRVETENGLEQQLGGGCGLFSGVARAGCAVSSAHSITLSLRNAVIGVPSFLFLSTNQLGLSEGGCTLYADPFSGFLVATGLTDGTGAKDFQLPLSPTPALVGLSFYMQWGTYLGAIGSFTIGGVPTGLNLSTAVKATFQ